MGSQSLNERQEAHTRKIKTDSFFDKMSIPWDVSCNIWNTATKSSKASSPFMGFVEKSKASQKTTSSEPSDKASSKNSSFSITETAKQSIWGNYQPSQYVFFTGKQAIIFYLF